MYTVAAVTSVLFPMIAPFFVAVAYRTKNNPLLSALVIGVVFGMLASCVETIVRADIDRYTDSLLQYKGAPFLDIVLSQDGYSGQYAYSALFWLIANTGLGGFL